MIIPSEWGLTLVLPLMQLSLKFSSCAGGIGHFITVQVVWESGSGTITCHQKTWAEWRTDWNSEEHGISPELWVYHAPSHSDPTHTIFHPLLTTKTCPTVSSHAACLEHAPTNNCLHFNWTAGWPHRESGKWVSEWLFKICFTAVSHGEGFALFAFLHPFISSHPENHWGQQWVAVLFFHRCRRN